MLYTFLLERDFLVPESTPVMAQIGNERLNAQITAIQGMDITLALQRDPGPTIARVEISVDPTAILERILTRLEDPAIAGLSDTLARMAFGYENPRFGQVEFTSVFDLSDESSCGRQSDRQSGSVHLGRIGERPSASPRRFAAERALEGARASGNGPDRRADRQGGGAGGASANGRDGFREAARRW